MNWLFFGKSLERIEWRELEVPFCKAASDNINEQINLSNKLSSTATVNWISLEWNISSSSVYNSYTAVNFKVNCWPRHLPTTSNLHVPLSQRLWLVVLFLVRVGFNLVSDLTRNGGHLSNTMFTLSILCYCNTLFCSVCECIGWSLWLHSIIGISSLGMWSVTFVYLFICMYVCVCVDVMWVSKSLSNQTYANHKAFRRDLMVHKV